VEDPTRRISAQSVETARPEKDSSRGTFPPPRGSNGHKSIRTALVGRYIAITLRLLDSEVLS